MIFKCTQCGQTLRAADSAVGKFCKCSACQTLVKIPASTPTAPVQSSPTKRSPQSVRPQRPMAQPKLNEDLSRFIPPVNLETARPPDNEAPPPRRRRRRAPQASRSQNHPHSSGPSLVVIVLSSIGGLCVLCCGGLLAIGIALGPKSLTITAGGYSATAQGREVQKRTEAGGETQGGMHPYTGSEFWIGSITMPIANGATIDDVRSHFQSFTTGSIESVQRGSMQGIHCTGVDTRSLGINGGDKAEFELFLARSRILYLAYIPGSSKIQAHGQTVTESRLARERTFDNVDAFFRSLRPD